MTARLITLAAITSLVLGVDSVALVPLHLVAVYWLCWRAGAGDELPVAMLVRR